MGSSDLTWLGLRHQWNLLFLPGQLESLAHLGDVGGAGSDGTPGLGPPRAVLALRLGCGPLLGTQVIMDLLVLAGVPKKLQKIGGFLANWLVIKLNAKKGRFDLMLQGIGFYTDTVEETDYHTIQLMDTVVDSVVIRLLDRVCIKSDALQHQVKRPCLASTLVTSKLQASDLLKFLGHSAKQLPPEQAQAGGVHINEEAPAGLLDNAP